MKKADSSLWDLLMMGFCVLCKLPCSLFDLEMEMEMEMKMKMKMKMKENMCIFLFSFNLEFVC
jgi:hypothetical protein